MADTLSDDLLERIRNIAPLVQQTVATLPPRPVDPDPRPYAMRGRLPTPEESQRQFYQETVEGLKDSPLPNVTSAAAQAGLGLMSLYNRAVGNSQEADDLIAQSRMTEQATKQDAAPGWWKERTRGVMRSGLQMMAAGPTAAPGAIALNTASAGNEASYDADQAGLTGGKKAAYVGTVAGIEGIISTFFQMRGMGGAESLLNGQVAAEGFKAGLKALGKGVTDELREETAITLSNALANKLYGVDPKATDPKRLAEDVFNTAVETVMMMGVGSAPNLIASTLSGSPATPQTPIPDEAAPARPQLPPLNIDDGLIVRLKKALGDFKADAQSLDPQPEPSDIPEPRRPRYNAATLRTPEGAKAFAEANPEAVADILKNPSRRNIAKHTGTSAEDWSKRSRRNEFVRGLPTPTAQADAASPTAPLPPSFEQQAPTSPTMQPPAAEPIPALRLPDVLPAGDDGASATAQQPSVPANRFTTAQGSTYEVHEDGTTTRTKSPHQGHDPKDAGLKPRSQKTFYVSPEVAQQVGMWNTLEADGKRIVIQGDKVTLISKNPKTGAHGRDGRYDVSNTPQPGLHPLELWDADSNGWYRGNHPGSAITSIDNSATSPSSPERTDFDNARDEVSKSFGGVAVDAAEHDDAYQPAIDAAKELGIDMRLVRTKAPYRGSSHGKTFLVNVDGVKGDDAIWYVAGHEIAHSSEIDKSLQLTDDQLKYYGDRYLERQLRGPAYRKLLEQNPERMKREAVAGMVGDFMTDEGFRNEVFAENRGLWGRIVDAVSKLFSSRKLTPAARKVLNALKEARQKAASAPSLADMSEDDLAAHIERRLTEKSEAKAEQPPRPAAEKKPKATPSKPSEQKPVAPSVEAAKAEFTSALDELSAALKSRGLMSNPQFDPELVGLTAKVVAKGIKLGIVKFADLVNTMKDALGEAVVRRIGPMLRDAWGTVREDFAVDRMDQASDVETILGGAAATEGSDDGRRERPAGDAASAVGAPVLGVGARGPGGESSGPAARTPDGEQTGGVSDGSGREGGRSEDTTQRQPRSGRRGKRPDGGPSDRDGSRPERAPGEGTDAGDEEAVGAFQSNADGTSEPAAGSSERAVNHRIGPDDNLLVAGPGAKKTRAVANIKAIKLLKQLEAEDREATPEEKKTLAQYVGWGGLKGYFSRILGGAMDGKHSSYLRNEAWEKKYGREYKEIRQLLTEEEWNAAASSTQNAHYTDRRVIERMWEIAEQLGFDGGKVWEPAAGVGHFFGLMPEKYVGNTKLIASEKDSLSARITAKLYPRAKVFESALENLAFPNNTIDLAISNVPFSAFQPSDAQKRYGQPLNLHNYFLARMIDAVRPGGLVVAISTFRTMDAQTEMRRFLAGRANLVGAIRLPNTAFKENADTEIPTDIIILQKPLNTHEAPAEPFGGRLPVQTPDGATLVNEYFARHPEMVLGEHSLKGTMYGGRRKATDAADEAVDKQTDEKGDAEAESEFASGEYTVMPKKGMPLDVQLAEAITRLPRDVLQKGEAAAFNFSSLGEAKGLRENSVQIVDGKVAIVKGGRYVNPQDHGLLTKATELKRAKEYVGLRDHYKSHLALMLSTESTDAQVEESRKALEKLYDGYHKRNGMLHGPSTKPLSFDPDFYLVRGLEKVKEKSEVDKKTGEVKQKTFAAKSDVLSKRTLYPTTLPTSAGSTSEAIRLSSFYKGSLDIEYVAQLIGKPVADAEAELAKSGEAYKNPESGLWEPKSTYLSGNVRQKLAAAQLATKDDKAFESNVAALEKVLPAPKKMANIRASIASTWIPAKVHEQFLREKLSAAPKIVVQYNEAGDRWDLAGNRWLTSEAAKASFGTERVDALTLYEQALNMKSPTVIDHWKDADGEHSRFNPEQTQLARAKQTVLQEAFATWLKNKKEFHEELETIFNERYNSIVLREDDSSDLPLPGASTTIVLRPHQMRGVRRFINDGQGLMAHAVGSGKTFAQIAIAMESKRLGLAKKPLLVVQNATLTQFAASFHQMYPAANVLVATKNDLAAEKRQAFLAQMTANDYDAVIMPQSSFDLLPVAEERQIAYINGLIEELERAVAEEEANDAKSGKKRRGKSDLEKQLDKLRDRMKTLTDKMAARAEQLLTFEDLGIDLLFIDEAHAYKKPPFYTKLERIVGLNKSTSQRAFNMLLKARAVQEKRNGKGVILATGTPITNTMGEAYHMLNICAPNVLKEYAVEKFDQFASTFFQVKQVLTTNAAGRFTNKTALHGWMNQSAFRRMLRSAWDIITTTQLHDIFKNDADPSKRVDLPRLEGGKTTIVAVPITKAVKGIKKFLGDVYDRFAALTGEAKKEASWVPLVTYGLSKASALDIRLVYPQAADDPGSKVNECVKRTLAIYNDERYAKLKGTQLIFCDSFNPMRTGKLMEFVEGKEIDLDLDDREEVETDDGVKLQAEGEKEGGGESLDKKGKEPPFLYADLRKKLAKGGIPIEQIAIITEHDTDKKRADLFEKVKNGDVRILIGSTPKMGVGVNVQDRLCALHHLDAPWLPADLEQRNGRIMRQGNLFATPAVNEPVQVLSYGMIDTLDAGLYASILRKAQNIEGALSSQADEDLSGDDDPFSGSVPTYQEQMAILSGDTRVMEKLELTEKIKSWEMEREAFLDAKSGQERQLETMQDRLDELTGPRIAKQRSVVAALEEGQPTSDTITGSVDKKSITGAADLGKAIDDAVKAKAEALFSLIKSGDISQLDETNAKRGLNTPDGMKNFPNHKLATFEIGKAKVEIVGYASARAKQGEDGKGLTKEWTTGIAARMEVQGLNLYNGNAQTGRGLADGYLALADRVKQTLTAMENEAERLKVEIPKYEMLLTETFGKTDDLANARARIKEIDSQLAAEGEAEEKAAKERGAKGASQQAQEEADEDTYTEEGFASGATATRRTKNRTDFVPDIAKVADEEVERRMSAAHGMKPTSSLEKLKGAVETLVHKGTRAQEFLPNTGEWAYENEWFRLLKEIPAAEQDEAIRTIGAVVDPLGPKQRHLFERKLMIDNLLAAFDRGEPLRFGFKDREQMAEYRLQLAEAIAQTPEVKKALETRTKVVKELVGDLVKYDLIGEEALENAETYFHHQVLSKVDAARVAAGGTKPNPVRRSFQKARVQGDVLGEEYDVNTDFIQAELEWMQEARVELAKAKKLAELEAKRDIKPQLKTEAKRQNFETLVGGPGNVKRIIVLRRLIKESRESENADESDERAARKMWIEELEELDPAYPYRKKIAMFASRIRRAWKKKQFTAPGFAKVLDVQAGLEDAESLDDLNAGWFRFLSWAASERGDEPVGLSARGIFKAIQDRKRLIQDRLGKSYVEWSDIVPDTHELWQPEPGNYFYEALAVPDKIAEQLQAGIADKLSLSADELRQVLVMAGPKKQLALRKELVEQLRTLEKPKTTNAALAYYREGLGWWKGAQMYKPTNYIANSVRNLLSDVEAGIGAAPGLRKFVDQKMLKELWDFYSLGTTIGADSASKIALSPELRAARDLGVLRAGFQAQELPDVKLLDVFARFYNNDASAAAKLLGGLKAAHNGFQSFREAITRYAAFLYYRDALQKRDFANFGGAKPDVVRGIQREMGTDAAAAHLSRNLLGDYGNLTVLGNWLRSNLLPFWSWNEINLKRTARLILNARVEGKIKGKSAAKQQAMFTAVALVRMGWMVGALAAWNMLLHGDDEDELGEYDRAKPHLTLGRNADGTINLIRNVSGIGDALEWVGLSTFASLMDDVKAGQMSWFDAMQEAAKDPLNKLISAVGPQIKFPVELAGGKTYFPDALNPRTTDREDIAIQNLGIRDEYLGLKGALFGTGDRTKPHYMQRVTTPQSVVDPRENALHEIYGLRDRYLKREGKDVPPGDENMRNMRLAVAQNDPERFKEARAHYLASGKSWKNFEASLRRLDPIAASMNADAERKFANEYLTPVQRQRLDIARDYARTLEVGLRLMWKQASAAGDTPEEAATLKRSINHSLMNAADVLAEAPPFKLSRRQDWNDRGASAFRRIDTDGASVAELRNQYSRYLETEINDPVARATRLSRFTQRLLQFKRSPN